MRKEYDFSAGIKNPYVRQRKSAVTIRLDQTAVAYFKQLSEEMNLPYQTLINLYLTDCAQHQLRPNISWQ